ncbi:hypothetical protein PTI98_013376 [Pleurotus ostreatus]|nr:hypothetical protein PTI98_013376 [Pleurotus ostreatus]
MGWPVLRHLWWKSLSSPRTCPVLQRLYLVLNNYLASQCFHLCDLLASLSSLFCPLPSIFSFITISDKRILNLCSTLAFLAASAAALQIEPLENAHSQGDVRITWINEADDA